MNSSKTRTLAQELPLHRGETVWIGIRSSFQYVGPAEEAISDLDVIDAMRVYFSEQMGEKVGFAKIGKSDLGVPIGTRMVKKVYPRGDAGTGTIIIVEGREFGWFWSREEYLKGKKKYLAHMRDSEKVAEPGQQ